MQIRKQQYRQTLTAGNNAKMSANSIQRFENVDHAASYAKYRPTYEGSGLIPAILDYLPKGAAEKVGVIHVCITVYSQSVSENKVHINCAIITGSSQTFISCLGIVMGYEIPHLF